MPRKAVIDLGDSTLKLAWKILAKGDDYFACKKVPLEVRRAGKSPVNFFRRCELVESEEWVRLPIQQDFDTGKDEVQEEEVIQCFLDSLSWCQKTSR